MVMPTIQNPRLREFLDEPGHFAIYGTGAAAQSVVAALAERDLKPGVFVDSHRSGDFAGLPMIHPEALAGRHTDWVITASMYAREMTMRLRAAGWEGRVLDLTVAHQPRWTHHFDVDLLDESVDAIAAARQVFADEASRRVFDAVLAHRRSLHPASLEEPTPSYRHPELPVAAGEVVLDVGAFDGSVSVAYAEAVGPQGHVHAFEPAAENLERFHKRLESRAVANISVHGVGCWHHSGTLRLCTDGGDPSQFFVSSSGGEEIRVTSIDDFVRQQELERVDWIKLDVEGSEHQVLEGASETIQTLAPKLAVCVYHRPRDLWELPLELAKQATDYDLFLAHHSQRLFDSVCYARPSGSRQGGESHG